MAEIKEKHIEIVQNIINRLANNSFYIKGWSITLLTALIAVYASTKNISFVILSILPVIIFWLLDSYYLWQERLFRKLYECIVNGEYPSDYSINLKQIETSDIKYISVVFSKTILPIYLGMIVIICLIYLIMYYA